MSVSTTQFIVYGVSVGYQFVKDWEAQHAPDDDLGIAFHNHFEKFYHEQGHDGIRLIVDGMNGKHLVIGKVLLGGKRHDILANGTPTPLPKITVNEAAQVYVAIQKHFGLESIKPEIIVYTHYH